MAKATITTSGSSSNDVPPDLGVHFPSIRDIRAPLKDPDDTNLPVEFLLVTVKNCEFIACYMQLKDPFRCWFIGVGYVYFGDMPAGQEKKVKVALIRCYKGSTGPGSSLITVKNAATKLKPKGVISVGTCSGLNPEKTKLGDVVVSAKLTTYASKIVTSTEERSTGMRSYVSRHFLDLIKHAGDGWEAPLQNPAAREVKVHCDGEFLSGPEQVSAGWRREELAKSYPLAAAIEMEGEGIFTAAFDDDIEWLVVKGIADFADGTENVSENWSPFASVMAASVVANILSDPVVFHQWPHYKEVSAEEPSSSKRTKAEGEFAILPPAESEPRRKLRSSSFHSPVATAPAVKDGCPSEDELEELSTKLGDKWAKLGRRLGFAQATLDAFHKENERLFDKAYRMLLSWKKREGSDATYQVLFDALCHGFVNLRILAEEFCCQNPKRDASAGDYISVKSISVAAKRRPFFPGSPDVQRPKLPKVDISDKSKSVTAKRRPLFPGSPDVQRPKLPKVKRENPSYKDLERLSSRIAERWIILGRRLNVEEQQLIAFDMECMDLSEKAYRMLQHWKQREGSAASYRVLHDALAHEFVGRKDLATEFCCDFKTSLRAASAGLQAENKVEVELSVKELDTKSESKMMVELPDEDLNTKAESKGEVDLSDEGLGVKSENKVKGELPDEELGTNSGNKANVKLSHEELDTRSESKIKLEPSDEVLDTKSQSKVKVGQLSVEELNTKSENMGEVELSHEELGTKSESKIELEPSDEELGTISKNKIKVELPVEELDTKSESKANVELLQERQKPDSENRTKTMYNADSEECEICQKGAVWKLQDIQAAAYITFPQNAVTQAVLFRCTRKESTIHSPPLKKDEALVSNVIELSCDDPSASKFTGEFDEKVSVALCHSAANLKGYEVVIRELIDSDNDEWKDLETTNVWQASEIQGDLSSKPTAPFAEAEVTCCSTFAVICRLKSHTYSANALDNRDFTCIVQEYPNVSVTIPASAVHAHQEFQLTLKVQEIPNQWFEESEIIFGPVLHIACSNNDELLEPATITIPILLQADEREFTEFSSSNVRVLVNSDEETSDWKEITHQLPSPVDVTNGVVRFQVTHFSKWHVVCLRERLKRARRKSGVRKLPLSWYKPNTKILREAGFFACLCSTDAPGSDHFLLKLCCYPIHMESRVKRDMHSEHRVLLHGAGNSIKQLCESDDVRVSTLKGLKAKKDLKLRFIGVENFKACVAVRRDHRCTVPEINFIKYIRGKRTIRLCELSLAPPALTTTTQSQTVREEIVNKEDLEKLSRKIGEHWKALGRRLNIEEAELKGFHKENEEYSEKAYQMLLHWQQRDGTDATYRVLHNALVHSLVNRKDLAEQICCG